MGILLIVVHAKKIRLTTMMLQKRAVYFSRPKVPKY